MENSTISSSNSGIFHYFFCFVFEPFPNSTNLTKNTEFRFDLTFGDHVRFFWDPNCSVDGGFWGRLVLADTLLDGVEWAWSLNENLMLVELVLKLMNNIFQF